MSDVPEREDRDIERIAALAGEHFGDYVLIVRLASDGVAWRASNTDWGRGAMRRYRRRLKEIDSARE